MLISRLFIIILVIVFPSISIADGPYYVDNLANGSGDGSSWSNAWTSFSSINWGTVASGSERTVYISGGETSKTYTGVLNINASGTSGNPIKVKPGQDASHNGIVIIDNNYSNSSYPFFGIYINGVSNITIDGRVGTSSVPHIKITRSYYAGVAIKSTSTRYIDIGYIESHTNGEPTSFKQGTGIIVYEDVDCSTDIVNIHDSIFHDSWDDDVYFRSGACSAHGRVKFHNNELYGGYENSITANMDGVDIYDNWFHGPPQSIRLGGDPHYNCIQTNGTSSYMRIWNNFFDDFPPEGRTMDAPIRFAPSSGNASHIRIFNNIFVSTTGMLNGVGDPQTMPFMTVTAGDPSLSSLTDVLISNNTLVGSPGYALYVGTKASLTSETFNNILVLNNLFFNSARAEKVFAIALTILGTGITWGSFGDNKTGTFDGNLFNVGSDGVDSLYYGSIGYTYSNFKSACTSPCNDIGTDSDPLLDSSYAPTSASPSINAGIDLSQYCSETPEICQDKNGYPRQSGNWDVGAYEYVTIKSLGSPSSFSGGAFQ